MHSAVISVYKSLVQLSCELRKRFEKLYPQHAPYVHSSAFIQSRGNKHVRHQRLLKEIKTVWYLLQIM